MRKFLRIMMLVAMGLGLAEANELRTWTASGGSQVEAKLIDNGYVYTVLERADGTRVKIRAVNLSKKDQHYLRELKLASRLSQPEPASEYKIPLGEISAEIKCEDDPQYSYYLYLPSNFHTGRKWPVVFVQSPSGGSPNDLKRYIPGAEKNGWILALSRQSKNGFKDSQDAIIEMIEDVYEQHLIDEKRMYSSGASGGARQAFFIANEYKREPLAGVLASGAGSSGYSLDKDTVVYGLCGSNCFNRWDMACTFDSLNNDDSRLWFFPGGHTWGNAELISDGICWLNGCYLRELPMRDKELADERYRYSKMMLDQIGALSKSDPERAYRLARFMREFEVSPDFKPQLTNLIKNLKERPTIQKYDAAEEEMYDLVSEYFATHSMDYRNNNCPKELTRDANKIADKYSELKLSQTIRRMGGPTKIP